MSGKAKTVKIEMDAETLEALSSLVGPCTLWARSQGAPDPALGDIVGLAIKVLAAQMVEGAETLLAETGEVDRPAMH